MNFINQVNDYYEFTMQANVVYVTLVLSLQSSELTRQNCVTVLKSA